MDARKMPEFFHFWVGSTNGIVYVFELISGNRIIFKNHSDKITNVKINPNLENHTIVTCSRDWSIRLFDLVEETQIAIYQDPFNTWISGKTVCWHDDGDKFLSICDRGGFDLIHFWYTPDNPNSTYFPELEDLIKKHQEENDGNKSENSSDSEGIWEFQKYQEPKCLSYYREYRNISKNPILQLEYFGDAFILANEFGLYFLAPYNEKDSLETKRIKCSDFLEFKIVDEILYVNTRSHIKIFDLHEVITTPGYEHMGNVYEIPKNKFCRENEVERMCISSDRTKLMIFNWVAILDIYWIANE
jgi:WD40 repeat protein